MRLGTVVFFIACLGAAAALAPAQIPNVPSLMITEFGLAAPNWVEVMNTTGATLDVSGWQLWLYWDVVAGGFTAPQVFTFPGAVGSSTTALASLRQFVCHDTGGIPLTAPNGINVAMGLALGWAVTAGSVQGGGVIIFDGPESTAPGTTNQIDAASFASSFSFYNNPSYLANPNEVPLFASPGITPLGLNEVYKISMYGDSNSACDWENLNVPTNGTPGGFHSSLSGDPTLVSGRTRLTVATVGAPPLAGSVMTLTGAGGTPGSPYLFYAQLAPSAAPVTPTAFPPGFFENDIVLSAFLIPGADGFAPILDGFGLTIYSPFALFNCRGQFQFAVGVPLILGGLNVTFQVICLNPLGNLGIGVSPAIAVQF